MKKKWINFFGCLAIGLAIFTSCNDDNADPIIDDGDPEVTGEGMFSALISNLPTNLPSSIEADTRAPGDDEDKITDIRIVLFNTANNGTVEYSWDMGVRYTGTDFFGPDVTASGTDNFTTTARLVKKQPYHMVVLVNPSEALRAVTEPGMLNNKTTFEAIHISNNLSALIGQASGSTTSTSNQTFRFFMTNADSYVLVREQDLKPTKEAAELAPVGLKVERAVAKVVLKNGLSNDQKYDVDYKIANVSWKLDITNKKTYWMRKPTFKLGGTVEEDSDTEDALRYAEDPNFKNFSGTSSLTDEFNYIVKTDISDAQTWGDSYWEYAMENTMEAREQMQDVTTRVIIKANYIPKKADIIDGNFDVAGTSYYTYMGYYITQAQMTSYKNNVTPIPEHYPLLYKAIQAALVDYDLDGNDDSFSINGLNFYKGGISYYKVLIRHFTNLQTNNTLMAYGRYGVVRNNVYEVTINSFSGAGDVDIPGTGGPDPNEEDENWVAAKVEIKPWVERKQGNDL